VPVVLGMSGHVACVAAALSARLTQVQRRVWSYPAVVGDGQNRDYGSVFDCFGAGQHVTQVTFGGADWQGSPAIATSMFTVFAVMRQLKQLLWYVAEGLTLLPAGPLHDELYLAWEETERLTNAGPDELAVVNATAHRQEVGGLLERVSQVAR
jgi:hypothetical protein